MTTSDPHYADRTVAVASGKGGVGKTSTAANLGAAAARGGLVTCIIDLDVTDGIAQELGMMEASDHGAQLVDAVLGESHHLQPVNRPMAGTSTGRLDAVFGGDALTLFGELPDDARRGLPQRFQRVLQELAPRYDLIILDAPPGSSPQLTMALCGAGWVLASVNANRASISTLKLLVAQVADALRINPQLAWVGVQIFAVPTAGRAILREAQERVSDTLDQARASLQEIAEADHAARAADLPLIPVTIRHSAATATRCSEMGLTARELADDSELRRRRFAALRQRFGASAAVPTAAAGVAADYDALAQYVIGRLQEAVR